MRVSEDGLARTRTFTRLVHGTNNHRSAGGGLSELSAPVRGSVGRRCEACSRVVAAVYTVRSATEKRLSRSALETPRVIASIRSDRA